MSMRLAAAALVVLAVAACSTSSAETQTTATVRAALAAFPEIPQLDSRYYDRFPTTAKAGWSRSTFFPVGTFLSSVRSRAALDHDRALGLNTYYTLTDNSNTALLDGSGFSAVLGAPFGRRVPGLAGSFLGDELDMRGGPGNAPVGPGGVQAVQPCLQSGQKCGYSALAASKKQAGATPGAVQWANYGKGVAYWETDQEAAAFVNGFTDVVSTDVYWYTDPAVCDEAANSRGLPRDQCRRAGNYGALIDRERALDRTDGREQPILAVVETGAPGDGWATIRPEQMAGAVMSSVIHGARGVVYFDHNFGGSCRAEHGLRDCDPAMQTAVRTVDRQLQDMAPALNVPARAMSLGPGIDATVRTADGAVLLIAMIDPTTGPGSRTFHLPSTMRGWRISAPYENRSITRTGADSFTDTFAQESSYHVYRIQP